jgi:DNA-binding FadR family transcriptional regulator
MKERQPAGLPTFGGSPVRQIRQPRLAEMIAARVREDILTGRLKEGDVLANQERLFSEYQVSPPALREAMRILETDGLITVRRGNVGGAVVHTPTPQRAAQMIAMVLQTRETSSAEVSVALGRMEPICARLCALRADRATAVVPALRENIARQRRHIEDTGEYLRYARHVHGSLVALCGNESLIVVIGALQAIWSAHDSLVWETVTVTVTVGVGVTVAEGSDGEAGPSSLLARGTRRAALRAHERLADEIEAGNADKAYELAAAHLRASHANTLRTCDERRIVASLLSDVRPGLSGPAGPPVG